MEHIHQLANAPGFVKAVETPGNGVAFVIANRLLNHVVLEVADARALYAALRDFEAEGLLED